MTNNKESYKLLNAELMAEVQKLRLMIAEYKRQVVTLVRENMGLREAQILQNAGQRRNQICGIRNKIRRWKLDSDCLGSPSVARATRAFSSSGRRDNDIDIVMEVSEEAPETGRLMLRPPPIIRNRAEADDDDSSEDEENWQADESLFRKIASSCWPRARIL